jgi:hypothetical protein
LIWFTWALETDFVRRKHDFSCFFFVVAKLDDLPVWKSVFIFLFSCLLERAQTDGAIFFFDLPNKLKFSTSGQVDSTFPQETLKMRCDISSGQIHPFAAVGKRIPFIDWNNVSDPIS